MSVRKNIKNAEDSMKPLVTRHSGWIVDAPEKAEELQPPPNPEKLFPNEDEEIVSIQESIELKQEARTIPLRPIDLAIDLQIPKDTGTTPIPID